MRGAKRTQGRTVDGERLTANEDDSVPNPELRTSNPKPRRGFTTEAQSGVAFDRAHAEVRNQSSSSCSSSCSCSKRGGINWTGFVCPFRSACALSAAGLAEMRFVRQFLARRWVGRASRRASFQAVQRWLSASGSTEARRSLRPPDVSSFCELLSFSRLCPPSKD